MTQIYYICETPEKKFHFSESHDEMEAIETQLVEKYGYRKNSLGFGISDMLDKLMTTIPKYQIQTKELKNYYGTIYLCVKWEDMDHVAYSIHSHWKTAKGNKEHSYDIKKIVLTPYEDWNNRFEGNDFDPEIPETGLF